MRSPRQVAWSPVGEELMPTASLRELALAFVRQWKEDSGHPAHERAFASLSIEDAWTSWLEVRGATLDSSVIWDALDDARFAR